MKTTKTLLLLGAASLALAHASVAALPAVVRIVGSNGDRVATTQAILNLLTSPVFKAGNAASATASNFSTITGTYASQAITVQTAFIGATGGIKAVAGNEDVRFLPLAASGANQSNPLTTSNFELRKADFAVSTNFQSTSPFIGEYQGNTYIELKETLTGVVALNFLGSFGFPGDNITTPVAQILYKNGSLPLAFFTGATADRTKTVFAIGRNTDAGQRFGVLGEIGLGVNAAVQHYQPTIATGNVVNTQALWPAETISGVSSGIGNGGYNSGANLVAALNVTLNSGAYTVGNPSATAGYYVGYLTPSDAATAVAHATKPAKLLKYNGVTYSQAALEEGQYSAWVYTRVLYDPELEGTDIGNFADVVATEVKDHTIDIAGSGGIKLVNIVVKRTKDGGAPFAKYF